MRRIIYLIIGLAFSNGMKLWGMTKGTLALPPVPSSNQIPLQAYIVDLRNHTTSPMEAIIISNLNPKKFMSDFIGLTQRKIRVGAGNVATIGPQGSKGAVEARIERIGLQEESKIITQAFKEKPSIRLQYFKFAPQQPRTQPRKGGRNLEFLMSTGSDNLFQIATIRKKSTDKSGTSVWVESSMDEYASELSVAHQKELIDVILPACGGRGKEWKRTTSDKKRALVQIIEQKNATKLQTLLDQGESLAGEFSYEVSPSHLTAIGYEYLVSEIFTDKNRHPLFSVLIKNGFDLDGDRSESIILKNYIYGSNYNREAVKLLLACGAYVDGFDASTYLHTMTNVGDMGLPDNFAERRTMAELLLTHHACVDAPDRFGKTPLQMFVHSTIKKNGSWATTNATKREITTFIDLLLSYGADINWADKKGNRVLHVAIQTIGSEIAAKLAPLDPIVVQLGGQTDTAQDLLEADHIRQFGMIIIRLLLERGAGGHLSVTNDAGQTPIDEARRYKLDAIAAELEKYYGEMIEKLAKEKESYVHRLPIELRGLLLEYLRGGPAQKTQP